MKNVGCNMFETRPTKRMLLQRDRIYNGKIQRIMRAMAISQHKQHKRHNSNSNKGSSNSHSHSQQPPTEPMCGCACYLPLTSSERGLLVKAFLFQLCFNSRA
uniref:Uncharacterized protein n=1 Tax=Bactrocera latifrons TaxID=174628 RepID=A0A0K8VQ53_BACLA